MSIKSFLSRGLSLIADKFGGGDLLERMAKKVTPTPSYDLPPRPAYDVSRYVHVSVPLAQTPDHVRYIESMLGQPDRPYYPVYLETGSGQLAQRVGHTYRNGNNYLKRSADELANATGMNNKQRRRLRTQMKRRHAELKAA